jgi:hypothetical protein
MRTFTEYLEETSFAKYGPGEPWQFNAAGQVQAAQLKSQGVDPTGPQIMLDVSQDFPKNPNAVLGKNTPGKTGMAFKNSKGQVWVAWIKPSMIHYVPPGEEGKQTKVANRGEIAEGILGAAMFAKFTKRQGAGNIGDVTAADVNSVLQQLTPAPDHKNTYQVQVRDVDNKHADLITFQLKLKPGPYQDLFDTNKRHMFANEFASAVGYANSSKAAQYSKFFYHNGKADHIAIIADGVTGEKTQKFDIKVAIRDEQGNMRNLNFATSLKTTGGDQFHQVYGSKIEKLEELFSFFRIDVKKYAKEYESKKDWHEAISFMYTKVAEDLSKKLRTTGPTSEARYVDTIADAIIHFYTKGDPAVEVAKFDAGGFKILRFNKLVDKLRDIDLSATSDVARKNPIIRIYDAHNPAEYLIQIRFKTEQEGKIQRNYVEVGPLLEKLTQVHHRLWKEPGKEPEVSVPRARRTTAQSDTRQRRR